MRYATEYKHLFQNLHINLINVNFIYIYIYD
jgi:hypothetical protein